MISRAVPRQLRTIENDRLYVFSRAGELFCLNLDDGQQVWRQPVALQADVRLPGWGCSAAPFIIGNLVILNVGESGVAINKKNGEVVWSSKDRESGYSTPVLFPDSDPSVVVIGSGKSYVAVED